jgi:thiaminase
MLFHKMKEAITQRLLQIQTHPFNEGLCQGTLPREIFQAFLEQDQLYLRAFAKALQHLETRFPEGAERQLFQQAHQGVYFELERLQQMRSPSTQRRMSFLNEPRLVLKSDVISQYTQHLSTNVHGASLPVAVASMLPCYYIYHTLGLHMATRSVENNPYQPWINAYLDKDFSTLTVSMIQLMDQFDVRSGSVEEQNIICVFAKSAEYESAFLDDVYHVAPKATPVFRGRHVGP